MSKRERDSQLYANDNNVEKWVRKEKHLSRQSQKKNFSFLHLSTAASGIVQTKTHAQHI